jgi:endonuclease/exonuclease/phosphatase family metal-dependent hydrolase
MSVRIISFLFLWLSPWVVAEGNHSLRIMTYNIHHAEGVDGKVDYERIAAVIRKADPHIVALQEVDHGTLRTQQVDQAKRLADLLNYQVVFGKALNFQGGAYGLAIMAHGNILSKRTFALPYRMGQEPRIILEAKIELGDEWPLIQLFNAHLCHLSAETRLEQVQRMIQIIPEHTDNLTLLAGDFNARPQTAPMDLLWKQGWNDCLESHDGIDYLLSSPGAKIQVKSSRIIQAPSASDHNPVFAELILKEDFK